MVVAGGGALYALFHLVVRKPERMYLWGHEFAHLLTAKLFLREVRSFHITSRTGGKVVIDRTNVLIDLAPYVFPLYSIAAAAAAVLLRGASPAVPTAYLAVASFLYAMHLAFSAEGFVDRQPDVTRSGRVFSAGVVALFLVLWIPVLAAPAGPGGLRHTLPVYRDWFSAAWDAGRGLLLRGSSFLKL